MAVQVSETHLPQLLSWLDQHLPHSFVIHGELKGHLRGHFPDLEFFVDRWPHPQAVVARLNPEKHQLMSKGIRLQTVDGIFGLKDEALSGLLKDPRVVAWNSRTNLRGTTSPLKRVLLDVVQEMGRTPSLICTNLYKASSEELKPLPCPVGWKIHPISSAELKAVLSTWKFSGGLPETHVEQYVKHNPSLCLVTEDGTHVGHMIGTSYGAMAMLHVNPEFRGKGYAKVIVSQLAQKYFDRGDDAFVFIEKENTVSQNLHKGLGFKALPDLEILWMLCD